MSDRLQAPRGTSDVLPRDWDARRALEEQARHVLEAAGYARIETPTFEATALFARGVGEATDVVQKEMYTFDDGGGRSVTLRPEGTAPICRAYVEHGMHKDPQPVRLYYLSPFYRHEAPQAGRFRQFWQVGAEALGSDDPAVDAETIVLLSELLDALAVRDVRLRLSSLGTPESRAAYRGELQEFLRANRDRLSREVQERIELNPLRAFDADDPATQQTMRDAPKLLDRLPQDDLDHLAEVEALLEDAGVGYEIDPTLVRGLDYYTRTVFEVESERLGAQAALGGGGRYDGLVEELGGPPTPGVGWAVGVERMLLAAGDSPGEPAERLFIAIAKPDAARIGFQLARDLREAGFRVETEQAGRSLKGQLKQADRLGAFATVILGDSIEVKDMQTGHQREAGSLDEVLGLVREVTRA